MVHKRTLAAGAALACLAGLAGAQQSTGDDAPPVFSLSGFGTLGASHSDNRRMDFSSNIFHANGAGYTRSWSGDVDTKLGAQVNANVNEKLQGVLQVVSQQNPLNSYKPRVEWANVSYKFTPDFSVRLGRALWPMLLRSETQNVGYGNPVVRNATELVANMPNSSSDGIDASYRFTRGAITNTTQVLAGNSDSKVPGVGATMGQNYLHVNDIRGVSNVLEYGDLKMHAAYMRMNYDFLYFDGLLSAVPYSALGLGFTYDPGEWYVTANLLKARDDAFGLATALTWGAGVRFGNFTPYFFSNFLKQDSVGYTGAGTPGDKQTVNAVGVRWDFRRNMDAKLQFEQVKSGPIGQLFPSSLNNFQPDFLDRPRANVISVVVDFVF